jgi:hypothetical protein
MVAANPNLVRQTPRHLKAFVAELVRPIPDVRVCLQWVWPFYVKRLLTQPEEVLYHRLVKSLPNHVVLAQVQMSRVLGVKEGVSIP